MTKNLVGTTGLSLNVRLLTSVVLPHAGSAANHRHFDADTPHASTASSIADGTATVAAARSSSAASTACANAHTRSTQALAPSG